MADPLTAGDALAALRTLREVGLPGLEQGTQDRLALHLAAIADGRPPHHPPRTVLAMQAMVPLLHHDMMANGRMPPRNELSHLASVAVMAADAVLDADREMRRNA